MWTNERRLLVRLERWRTARLDHLLEIVELEARLGLVLRNGQEVEQVRVADERDIRVTMLVGQPLPFRGVRVASADVLGLQMLQLRVDVVPVAHLMCFQ